MPLEPGDYITFAGVLAHDATGDFISAYQVLANVGAYTWPGTDPAYIAIDVIEQGTGGVTNPQFPQEDSARLRVDGFTTDPTRSLNITAVDIDCHGVAVDRLPFWVSGLAADQGRRRARSLAVSASAPIPGLSCLQHARSAFPSPAQPDR